MTHNCRLICITCISLGALLAPQFSVADYIGNSSFLDPFPTADVVQVNDSGGAVPNSYISNIPLSIRNQMETYVECVALTPDLKTVYGFSNTLGYANYILAWDTVTNQFRASDTFSPTGIGDNYVNNARQPVIIGNELFVTSFINGGNNRQVKRYDLTSHSLLQTIDPLTPQPIDDIALTASGSLLYVAGTSGIYLYTKTAGTYQSTVKSLLLPGMNGNIAVGPDNRLYVRNFATGDVLRFALNGSFEDTFLSHNDYPGLGTIQFGVDGNLHAFQNSGGARIRKFDPSTGALISTVSSGRLVDTGITYLPVPEPSGVTLLAVCVAFAVISRRAMRR